MYRRSRRRRARRDHGGVAPENPRDDRNRLPRVLHPERRRDAVPPRDGCAAAIWPAIESIARARSCPTWTPAGLSPTSRPLTGLRLSCRRARRGPSSEDESVASTPLQETVFRPIGGPSVPTGRYQPSFAPYHIQRSTSACRQVTDDYSSWRVDGCSTGFQRPSTD